MENQLKWDRRFLEMAALVASWSKDPSTKVGCVIANNLKIVIGLGYNGFPRGMDDSEERYLDREYKLPRIIHAEQNAIDNASGNVRGCTLYVHGLSPCTPCASKIINAGISRVVYSSPMREAPERWLKSMNEAIADLNSVGVPVEYIGPAA